MKLNDCGREQEKKSLSNGGVDFFSGLNYIYSKNDDEIKKCYINCKKNKNIVSRDQSYLNQWKNKLFKKGVILGLCSAAIIQIGVSFIPKVVRGNFVNTTTYVDDNELALEDEYQEELSSEETVVSENLENIDFNDISINYNLDPKMLMNYLFIQRNLLELKETLDSIGNDLDSIESDLAVIKTDVKEFREDVDIVFYRFVYIVLLYLIDLIYMLRNNGIEFFGHIILLITNIIDYSSFKEGKYVNDKKKLDNSISELVSLIQSNEGIRIKFNSCYEDFVTKYGENEKIRSMYDDVNSACYDEIKENKFVKKRIK